MIVLTVIIIVFGILKGLFWIVPSLPQMPEEITSAITTVFSYLVGATNFVSWLLTPQLLVFIVSTSILILTFDTVYGMVMWVLRKIPYLGIE